MNTEQQDVELAQWLSSYGLITIERILGTYQIRLESSKLSAVMRNRFGFFYELLKIPLKNVLNGIIIQQTHDYYVYAQKLFIDYLLSPETTLSENAPGFSIREALEEEREDLVDLGEEFRQFEISQDTFIGQTQGFLIHLTEEWNGLLRTAESSLQAFLTQQDLAFKSNTLKQALLEAFVQCDLEQNPASFVDKLIELLKLPPTDALKEGLNKDLSSLIEHSCLLEKLESFYPAVKKINESARLFRQRLYESILRTIDLIKVLPQYKINASQDLINRELLYFDKSIGEGV